jgi:hypothetical protein
VLAILAAVLVLASAGVAVAVTWRDEPGTPAVPGVADGSDPQEQHCQVDAVSERTVAIPNPDLTQPAYGSLTLRYSPRCRAAWPLFVSTEHVPPGVTIRLRANRPADGATSRFDYPYLVEHRVYSVFGNVLGTARGCVSVAVEISTADNTGVLAGAATPCLSPAG